MVLKPEPEFMQLALPACASPRECCESMKLSPKSVALMLDKFHRNRRPHKRKKIEVACVIHATEIETAAKELEELARTLRREGEMGYVGHGGGYYMSIAYAVIKNI